ncbi:MAG: acyltransferase family protein [Pseudomonadota bacterium]
MRYRPELDGIRAIAVAAVVMAHAGAPLPGGHLGVDIFFVLSGYLITRQIVGDLAAGRFSLRDFYVRRARRILPALGVVALACVPFAWLLLPPAAMEQFGQALVALAVFGSNFLFWMNAGYFAPAAAENPLIHTWSLAVEEQFYLVFPVTMLVLWRGARRWAGVAIAVLAVASLIVFVQFSRSLPDMVFYLAPFRVWELLAGALVAWISRDGWIGPVWGGPVGLVFVGLALGLGNHDGRSAWAWNVAVVTGTALVLGSGHSGTPVARILSIAPLRALGLLSYSTYLWHQPVFAFARVGRLEPLTPMDMTGLVAVTLVLSALTWWLVEQPLRQGPWPNLRAVAFGVVGCVLVGFGLTADLTKGMPVQRFSPEKQTLFASALASPERERCHGVVHKFRDCIYGMDPPRWAVLGDSHGVELAYALGEGVAARGEGLLHLTASSCPPALSPAGPHEDCVDWLEQALARLSAEPSIRNVVLTWRHALYLEVDYVKRSPPERYQAELTRIVGKLRGSGRRIIIMAPVPELRRDIALHIRSASQPALPVQSRKAYDTRHREFLGYLESLEVEVLHPAETLCDARHCYAAPGGVAAYFDDDHLSVAGARMIISPLLDGVSEVGALAR